MLSKKHIFSKKTKKEGVPDTLTHGYKISDKNLQTWKKESLPYGCEIVHAILLETSTLMSNPAEKLFESWDVISTSLVDIGNITQRAKINKNIASQYKGERGFQLDNGLYQWCKIGLVLDVPIQNILGTFDGDAWFPNNIGTEKGRVFDASLLSERIFNGGQELPKINGQPRREKFIPGGFNQIKNSAELQRSPSKYNEILIIGRPGINIYQGLPATKPIKVKAIYIGYDWMRFFDGILQKPEDDFNLNKCKRMLRKLKMLNGYNIPVIDPSESLLTDVSK